MMNLTTRQQHVLDTLINYQRKHGFPLQIPNWQSCWDAALLMLQ